uniref:Translation elongation factor EFTu/EF1A C-terminal domain-containing protein n=1 Tax=Periophthalmus magnuspinnatus TaxID=409849 RepID=A0A3B3ZRV5_9GOBI
MSLFMPQEALRTGEKAEVRFRFIKHPEYLKVGAKMLFREGVTKGIGHVTKLQPVAQYKPSQREEDGA